MDEGAIKAHLRKQHGVISRAQVLGADGDDDLIEQRIRHRVWARAFPGVYVTHTGPLTWRQRAWAAVLYHAPSALAGNSALHVHGLHGQAEGDPIELVIAHGRRVNDRPGIRTVRARDFAATTQLQRDPPRVRVEHAVLQVASEAATEDRAIAVVADACQRGRTTPARLRAALDEAARISLRPLLEEVLTDVGSGANSALEARYQRDVERAHGLPHADRQQRATDGDRTYYRDAAYTAYGLMVELDGRLGHELSGERWADLDRDLLAAESGSLTVRAGWRQALQPCRLAAAIARLLRARGWTGNPAPCSDGCPLGNDDRGDFPADGAGKSPRSVA